MNSKNTMEILLIFKCPKSCKGCQGEGGIRYWQHENCETQAYINTNGDIFCHNGCAKYFIRDAQFKCAKSQTCEKFKSLPDFCLALQSVNKAVELQMREEDVQIFIKTLSKNLRSKWYQE